MRVTVTCPYCGKVQPKFLDGDREIVNCDIDDGGCDEPFVIHVQTVTTATVYKMTKVEPAC